MISPEKSQQQYLWPVQVMQTVCITSTAFILNIHHVSYSKCNHQLVFLRGISPPWCCTAFQQEAKAARSPHDELHMFLESGIEQTTDVIQWWGMHIFILSKLLLAVKLMLSHSIKLIQNIQPWSALHVTTLPSKDQQPHWSMHSVVPESWTQHNEITYPQIGNGTAMLVA
jgi:hypothetical protein